MALPLQVSLDGHVHRVGRCGRGGSVGRAFAFLGSEESASCNVTHILLALCRVAAFLLRSLFKFKASGGLLEDFWEE